MKKTSYSRVLQLLLKFWETALIGLLGFLYDEIISVDTDFSTSLQLPAGRGLSLRFLYGCDSASELTEMTNHLPLSFLPPLFSFTFTQLKPRGAENRLLSLDEDASLGQLEDLNLFRSDFSPSLLTSRLSSFRRAGTAKQSTSPS